MSTRRLSELLAAVPNLISSPADDPAVTAPIEEDSRQVKPGGLFVARRGLSTDGHDYIQAAVDNGAAAVIGELSPDQVDISIPYVQVREGGEALAYLAAAYYGFPSRRLVMIGVTGTDGKTTTSNLIFSVLRKAGLRAGMISTIKAVIGDEEMPTGLHVTTPPAPEIQMYLARMVEAGLTHCVLEATSHGLAQHRVSACDFDLAVVTNIQHEHLDFHGTWEHYRESKAMLFHHLMAGTRKPGMPKTSVVNLDDGPNAGFLLDIPADRHLSYSLLPEQKADISVKQVDYRPASTGIEIALPDGGMVNIQSALVGDFNVSNILAAVSACYSLDIPLHQIKAGIEAVDAISGRMERIDEEQDFLAIVDFAHTPNALKQALRAARLMIPPEGRVIAVFGCAGLRDPAKRVMMGQIAAELADLTVITAEDPRTESLDEILATTAGTMAESGGKEGETFWRVPDRGRAIFEAVRMAAPGDIVIACGKGHEQSMCFGTVEYPWDDRQAMRSALQGAPLKTLPTA
ncbi:MAG: UDP-N-acetylmuramoyl-L-alanyl-D-glutamate--2,6-diaminopimelate ligase [Anaerolineae bacterium]|nr:UDP-N-acetylmuramoyl-L-alanyl-D-glutamate--2,6-diaminopimelate ligase [Anaerolineae bacterium]